jgi:hypothetical protein
MKKVFQRFFTHLRTYAATWISLVALVLLAWYVTGTSCTLHATVGLPCPGCGLTRAIRLAFQGRWIEALQMHPLFWLALLVLGAALIFLIVAPKKLSNPAMNRLWLAIALLFMIVYVVRMLFYFPDREPMTWNNQALLPRIFRFIRSLVLRGDHPVLE